MLDETWSRVVKSGSSTKRVRKSGANRTSNRVTEKDARRSVYEKLIPNRGDSSPPLEFSNETEL